MIRVRFEERVAEVDLVFFDCDGIIFDTNRAKSEAFDHAVAEAPDAARAELVALHQATGGISRYAKLRRFYTEIAPVEDVDAAVERALQRFGDYSLAAYRRLTPRPEALKLAEAVNGSGYVVSGADQAELVTVFTEQGIRDRWVEILGSPTDKPTHLRRVLAERGVAPERALFLGDGGGDLACAKELGVWFLFLGEMSDWRDGPTRVTAAQPELRARGVDAGVAATWADVLGRVQDGP